MRSEEHQSLLVRRRIKFVAEKGSMARLLKKGCNAALQRELFRRVRPRDLLEIHSQGEYDRWLMEIVQASCWRAYSPHDCDDVRWGHFAKLINIVVYEIVANREAFPDDTAWRRLHSFLHIPLDSKIMARLAVADPDFPVVGKLNGMTSEEYFAAQQAAREIAGRNGVSPIWFEAAWSA
jgi:hypothetical protein